MKTGKKLQKNSSGEKIGFRGYYGTTTMITVESMTLSLMQSFFMLYLTDYSGLGSWAASLGSALLVFARVFDAVNDPLEAWIMDRAKPGRWGKYRPFVFLSIILQAVGVTMLFSVPTLDSKFLVAIWVIVFYLVYDIGSSFLQPELIYRSMTHDEAQRGKLMIGPRMMNMAAGMVMSTLISIVAAVNMKINNFHTSFALTVAVIMFACVIIAISGIACVKEKYIAETNEEEKVKVTDIISVLKTNKVLQNRLSATVFSGFIYTCLFATSSYYLKWAYCANLTTGEVDTQAYGLFMMISSMMMFTPLILGLAIAMPMLKKFGSAVKMTQFNLIIQGAACGILVILHFTGILQKSPIPFFVCMAIVCIFMGADYIPTGVINMEVMDYERYVSGKDRAAIVGAVGRLLNKAQTAFATAAVGILLTSVGYVVDSATDTYLGDLSAIPGLLSWFIVIMALVPCICAFSAYFILRRYPLTDELRVEMKKKLEETEIK